jgi:putative ABC transport system permease protein
MFRNYLKIAFRNLGRNKLFSFINITGLAFGVTCCVLIFLYVQRELGFDRFNEKADRIYRLTAICFQPKKTEYFAPSSPIMCIKLQAAFPDVRKSVRITPTKRSISYNDRKFFDNKVVYADSSLFDIFTFPMIEGNPKKALSAPYSVVLTRSSAKKYFGTENATGKMMKLSDTINVMVTGIIEDIPDNSHLKFDCALSRSTIADMNKNTADFAASNAENWFNCDSYTYMLISETADAKALESRMNKFMDREMADIKKNLGMWFNINLQPLTDIHLRSHFTSDYKDNVNSDITYIYIFAATAALVLLIACCNFINLSTARSLNRSKEIGLRKVIGARRIQLVMQFLGESLLFSIIASVLSFLLVLIFVPVFNSFAATTLSLNWSVLWIYLAIICTVGILSGLYPALLMSSFAPVRSLKGHVSHGIADIVFRKGLVVFQFSIAIVLIISTELILQQLDFIQNRNLGMQKEQMLAFELQPVDARKGEMIIKELSRNPDVLGGTQNSFSFKGVANITLLPEGAAQNEVTACHVIGVDENFLKTFEIQLAEGRDFSKDFASDKNEAFIVNEAAVKVFNWNTPKEAIGKKVDWAFGKSGKVIGVVKDFNFASLHDQVQPLLIHIWPMWYRYLTVRLKTNDLNTTMTQLEATWKSLQLESPFKYTFLEDEFDAMYRSERNMRSVLSAFTFLSVFVACLGLFGLASYTIKQRFREIGIRRVLGASVKSIAGLLSKDFLKLVIISIVIAVPVAWFAAYRWLQDFAYKVDIGLWIFIVAALMSVLIAFATVSIQAIQAALANPVKSIRTE